MLSSLLFRATDNLRQYEHCCYICVYLCLSVKFVHPKKRENASLLPVVRLSCNGYLPISSVTIDTCRRLL